MFGNKDSKELGLGHALEKRNEARVLADRDSTLDGAKVSAEDFIDDKLEEYEAHSLLTRLIGKILSVNGKNKNNLEGILLSEFDVETDGVVLSEKVDLDTIKVFKDKKDLIDHLVDNQDKKIVTVKGKRVGYDSDMNLVVDKKKVDFQDIKKLTNLDGVAVCTPIEEELSMDSIVTLDEVEVDMDGIEEDTINHIADKIVALLKYLKVSQSTIDDLLDDDEEVSTQELIDLADHLNEKIGDQDLGKFIATAMNDTETDSVDMDDTFHMSSGDCGEGKKGTHRCRQGFSTKGGAKAVRGWWRRLKPNAKVDAKLRKKYKKVVKKRIEGASSAKRQATGMKAYWGSDLAKQRRSTKKRDTSLQEH